jgi:hypothetical protein
MYYDVEMVESELQCPICNQMFVDPRVLPCGNICCLKCIIGQFNETNTYKCKCKCYESVHEKKEESEYPKPKIINNLLDKTKNKISPKFIKLDFKEKLDEFKNTIDALNDKQRNYKSKLSDYCEHVRSQIIFKTECIVTDLNKHCDEMCKTIDEYENEKMKEWDNCNEEYRTSLTTLISDNLKIQHNMIELYKNQNVETFQIEDAIELVKQNSIRIEKESIEMSKKLFNLKYFQNDDEIDICSIGQIFKVEKCEKLNLTIFRYYSKIKVDVSIFNSIFDCSFSPNDKYLLVFHDYNLSSSFLNSCDLYDQYPVFQYKNSDWFRDKIVCYCLFNDHMIFVSSSYRILISKYYPASNKFEIELIKSVTNRLLGITLSL